MLRPATIARVRAVWCLLATLSFAAGCDSAPLLQVVDSGVDADDDGGHRDAADDGENDGGSATDADSGIGDDGPLCPEGAGLIERGDLAIDTRLLEESLAACETHRFRFIGAAGAELELALVNRAGAGVRLQVFYPDDPQLSQSLASLSALDPDDEVRLAFPPPRSGEFDLLVGALDPESGAAYDLAITCLDGCDRSATRFPIVLVHGWTGWDEVLSYTYFYGVEEDLTARGFRVFVPTLDPYNSVTVRSEQLAAQVETFLAEGHGRKVNLIAHSQGGLDARRLISSLGYGDRVGGLVTISTPHYGTLLADVALGLLPGPAKDALAFLLEWLGATAAGSESDAIASFESLTVSSVVGDFNPANPDDPRVKYVSYSGRTCMFGIGCGDACDVEIVWSHLMLLAMAGPNDGIVPVASGHWGEFRGEIPADHFDEVGQLLGVTGPNFDHRAFYRQLAFDLIADGL